MPVYPFNPVFQSCDLMIERGPSTPFSADGSREYSYRYKVVVRVPLDEIQVCFAPCLPFPFQLHPEDFCALCTNIAGVLQDSEDWGIWVVTVKYSTRMPDGGPPSGKGEYQTPSGPQGGQNNPEQEPPDIEWDSETITRAPPKDLDDKAFLNAAGQPFTPAPTFEYAYGVLSISRNELAYNCKTAAGYSFAVNKDKFLGFPPKTVQCMPPKAKLVFRGNIRHWRVSYRLRFGVMGDDGKPIPWDPQEILNQGLMELKDMPGVKDVLGRPIPKLVPITVAGKPISQPVALNPLGFRLDPVFDAGLGKFVMKPNWIKFRIRPALSFDDLIRNGLGGQL